VNAPIDAFPLIAAVRRDDDLTALARIEFAAVAPALFAPRDPKHIAGISASDCGRCVRELHGDLHDLLDLPDTDYLARDRGTLLGAWYAAMLKVGVGVRYPDFECILEGEATYLGVPGHFDLAVRRRSNGAYCQVFDVKTTAAFSSRAPHVPKRDGESTLYHAYQVGLYASGLGAPLASIVSLAGAENGNLQTDYAVVGGLVYPLADGEEAVPVADVSEEIARLRGAQVDAQPLADPQQQWRCSSCRLSSCPANRNPAKPVWPGLPVSA